jgi:NCS1 family nucleobase:cation symporter-1
LLVGAVAALLCVNTTLWTAPVATALGGADLSLFAGALVASAAYLLLRPIAAQAGGPVEAPAPAVSEQTPVV